MLTVYRGGDILTMAGEKEVKGSTLSTKFCSSFYNFCLLIIESAYYCSPTEIGTLVHNKIKDQ